jgi:hypothetical protein
LENCLWLDIPYKFLDTNNKNFAVETQHRLSFFDTEVIHISASGNVDLLIKYKNTAAFKQAFSSIDDERSTLVIAGDLSQAMIEAIGIQNGLKPEFFASHLIGTEEFRMADWAITNCSNPRPSANCSSRIS